MHVCDTLSLLLIIGIFGKESSGFDNFVMMILHERSQY